MTFKDVQEKYRQWTSLKRREAEAQQLGHDGVAKELFGRSTLLHREIVDAGWPDPYYMARSDESLR
ncbi:MAG: hypothetical protein JEZ10_03535 [Verrucomicrobia bacterium]|nr:hypothetical protein [Verrucomicrobiota bacterium]